MFETGRGKIFVLIHGTWHGGWAWKDVIQQLSEKASVAENIQHTRPCNDACRSWSRCNAFGSHTSGLCPG